MQNFIEKPKFNELRENLLSAENNYEREKKRHESMQIRFREIEANLPSLKSAVEDAGIAKEKSLTDSVLYEGKTARFEKAKKVLDLAKSSESDAGEFMHAIERALPQSGKLVVESGASVQGAKHELWSAIFQDISTEARAKVGNLIEHGFVAAQIAGGVAGYQGFLMAMFPPPGMEKIHALRKKIDARDSKTDSAKV